MSDQRFTLTEQHIKLLRRMNVGWCDDEFGAPEIDPKRPYGNSDVITDMREILGDPQAAALLRALHKEMQTALTILLRCGTVKPGEYTAERWTDDWKPTEEKG